MRTKVLRVLRRDVKWDQRVMAAGRGGTRGR